MDYRRLNARTKKDAFPLPRIDDSLNSLSGQAWFSTLDLASRYWQVRLSENAKPKTAFATHSGLFQFAVMPFGLCNAPATFEQIMNISRRTVRHLAITIKVFMVIDNPALPRTEMWRKFPPSGIRVGPSVCRQDGFKLSAWPTPVIEIVHNTDVSIDIDTDRPENSAPSNISDVNLFKCKVQDNREDRPMKGMTNSHQGYLLGSELAVADTNRELVGENQSYLKNTEETQFSYDTGLSSQELEDAIRREVLRNRLVGQVNVID